MPGDYTRLTFDPLRDRAMVLEQQGRVHLDADFNELVSILERRLRVETRDFTGPAVVPASLPQSFEITVSGSNVLIGRGRIYVDGLLAENHGYGAVEYEPVWDEPEYAGPTPIQHQPYQGTPITPNQVRGNVLVYLDVWQREETAVEDPSVLESALGVDTCTRVQTAWRVRVLKLEQLLACDSDWSKYGPWVNATAPSAGRLSSAAVNPPAPSDPCAVAPIGGYRGLENRLYRVEIHDGGGQGTATFKWSRDNGAVASRVTAIANATTQPIISVERLGRDQVLRFHNNDWVEVLDDAHEFDGVPGLMGQVLGTDSTENTVTLKGPLGGTIDVARNARLRRWDQQAGVNADGVIPLTALPQTVQLEDGVEVTLELADPTGSFKTGDWWVFAARAATASVEELSQAPPRGLRHHYARLAVINKQKVTDCRVVFPGECECEGDCECTACVTSQSHSQGELTLQKAIDQVAASGGRVCIAPGIYTIDAPLMISEAQSLTLAGAGEATVIVYDGAEQAGIVVQDSVEVSLERFALVLRRATVAGNAPAPAPNAPAAASAPLVGVALVNTADCRVERCFVLAGLGAAGSAAAFETGDVGIGLAGLSLRARLIENVVLATAAIGDLTTGRSAVNAVAATTSSVSEMDPKTLATQAEAVSYASFGNSTGYLLTADLTIADNLLLGLEAGVDFGAPSYRTKAKAAPTIHVGDTRIEANLIAGGSVAGLVLLGVGAQPQVTSASLSTIRAIATTTGPSGTTTALGQAVLAAIARRADQVAVDGNVLIVSGDGIRATTDGLRVSCNHICGAGIQSERLATGMVLALDRGAAAGEASVTDNVVLELSLAGVVLGGQTGSVRLSRNRISTIGKAGISTLKLAGSTELTIAENAISAVGVDDQISPVVQGIYLVGATQLRVSGNTVSGLARTNWRGERCWGIGIEGCDLAEVSSNLIYEVGPDSEHTGWVYGILAMAFHALDVSGNTVRLGTGGEISRDVPLFIGTPAAEDAPVGQVAAPGDAVPKETDPVPPGRPDLGVSDNTLYGSGREPVVWVQTPTNVTMAENRCRRTGKQRETPVVFVDTDSATIFSSNRVENALRMQLPAVRLLVHLGTKNQPHCTVLGNITSGPIALNNVSLGAPWAGLNIVA